MSVPSSLVHLVRPPGRAAPGGRPLLLLLHGVGSNEHDLFGLAPYFDERFVVVSARAPLTLGASAFGWFPVQFTPTGPIHDPIAAEQSRDLLETFLDEVIAAEAIDPGRVYLCGFSQGAIMSLYLGLTRPTKIAGIVAMSGRLLPEAASQRADNAQLSSLPILVQHGLYDQVLPIQFGREIRDALTALPVDLTYREYPMAHQVDTASLGDAVNWLSRRLDSAAP